MKRALVAAGTVTIIGTGVALATVAYLSPPASHPGHPVLSPPPVPAAPVHRQYAGVAAVTPRHLAQFTAVTGIRPSLVEEYTRFGTMTGISEAREILAARALPLIQLNPYAISTAGIAAGRWDAYLHRYGVALASLHSRVAISLAPEANGNWYEWGCHRTAPATYIAAWRHAHNMITAAGASNVIWVWDINKEFPRSCPLTQRWPGRPYVNWIGIDAYWRRPGDTYATAIAPTITDVRAFTGKHILISETGAPPGPQAVPWVHGLFRQALTQPGVIGLIWFNYHSGHGDFRLEDDRPALAAFRAGARSLTSH